MQKGYIRTFSGQRIYPVGDHAANRTLEKIKLVDIAHHLSQTNRYTGASRFPYTVGLHSLVCCMLAKTRGFGPQSELAALFHDGSEAYLTDLAAPVKDLPEFEPYRKHEAELQDLVVGKFMGHHTYMLAKPWFRYASVQEIDRDVFCAEWPVLMGEPEPGIPDPKPDAVESLRLALAMRLDPVGVRELFLFTAHALADELQIDTSEW